MYVGMNVGMSIKIYIYIYVQQTPLTNVSCVLHSTSMIKYPKPLISRGMKQIIKKIFKKQFALQFYDYVSLDIWFTY